jgi:formamidopyrimidine-DNA glycosylase
MRVKAQLWNDQMPELPEVETVCMALRPHLVGARIACVTVRNAALRGGVDASALTAACTDTEILAVRRRAKYILVDLSGPVNLFLHLGMTGSFRVEPEEAAPCKHDHLIWHLNGRRKWIFNDPRRFGQIRIYRCGVPDAEPAELASLGPEPLDDRFTGALLHQQMHPRASAVKSILLDQTAVAGIGNIYASEALFQSRIHPATPGKRVSRERAERLAAAVKQVLRDAIICGGTTIRDFASVDGSEGHFKACLNVYDRAGSDCVRCGPGHTVRRITQAGRSTFYCPHCQH